MGIWGKKKKKKKKKRKEFLQAIVMSVLLYSCSTWTLMKCQEKRLDGNYTRMLFWTSPGSSNCMATYLPSHKLSKQDMLATATEAKKLISSILWTPTCGQTCGDTGFPLRLGKSKCSIGTEYQDNLWCHILNFKYLLFQSLYNGQFYDSLLCLIFILHTITPKTSNSIKIKQLNNSWKDK